jgi:uncharacterized LabA/DUF88 family protein
MRVGVYIDGFNLYHGGREHCGRGAPGWRWLDLRALAKQTLPGAWQSAGATIERVVYCTARVSGATDQTSPRDQDVYLRALAANASADVIELRNFVARVRRAPLATERRGGKPKFVRPQWPVKVKDAHDMYVAEGMFMVSYAHREEKGSDVNVGAHLLLDVLQEDVDAAIVVSNDSDLAFPLRAARERVPVGTVNPGIHPTAGKLKGTPSDGVGSHWWRSLDEAAFKACQLPDPIGRLSKPVGW